MKAVDLEKWLAQFKKNTDVVLKVNAAIIEEAAEEFYTRVTEKTPIGNPALWKYPAPAGYVPGRLKASWEKDSVGTGIDKVITVSNAQPYAQVVEYGWSTQAPNGMMRLTILEWPGIIKSVSNGRA